MEDELKTHLLRSDMAAVAELIASNPLPNMSPDTLPDDVNALHLAAILGYVDVAKILVKSHASLVNCQDSTGWTPLMHAVANGHVDVTELLLDCPVCDISLVDNFQQTALHVEAQSQSGSLEMTKLLTGHGLRGEAEDSESMTPFMRAVEAGNVQTAQYIFKVSGCRINARSIHGKTVLHIAAEQCAEELLPWLLQVGAAINALDNRFQTPLMVCVQQKRHPHLVFRIMKHLVDAGSLINAQDVNGNTALLLAMSNPAAIKKHHIEFLLISSADANIPNRDGLTPLWQAIYDGIHYPDRLRIIRILLQENCYLEMTCRGRLLFTSGLDTVYCYENFLSPFEVAMDSGYYKAAKILMLAGCQVKPEMRYDEHASDIPAELQWFQYLVRNPVSLKHQCRLVVRCILGQSIQSKARRLPLPEQLKFYILLDDLFAA